MSLKKIGNLLLFLYGREKKRKAYVNQKECVACGCCMKVCPKGAIQVFRGIMAQVDHEKCIGCGRCALECPAGVITLKETAV